MKKTSKIQKMAQQSVIQELNGVSIKNNSLGNLEDKECCTLSVECLGTEGLRAKTPEPSQELVVRTSNLPLSAVEQA